MIHQDLLTRALDPATRWQPFRQGVDRIDLFTATDGLAVALLRYAPGAEVPPHRHDGVETILVLSGSQEDHRGSYGAGSLVVNEPGSVHKVRSPTGCIVLAHWQRPVVFLPAAP